VTAPLLERYVTAGELAELMGVSVRTVKAWTSQGMPSETWGMRARRYLPSEAMDWARARAPRHNMGRDHRPGRRSNATGPQRKE
jgi:phage terminase Nu1 subunit (DNA packaging protein)